MYQLKLVRADGTTEAYVRLLFADDDAAAERATELLAASKSGTVQVWQGVHLIFSAARELESIPRGESPEPESTSKPSAPRNKTVRRH
jgi:hypothetical protein